MYQNDAAKHIPDEDFDSKKKFWRLEAATNSKMQNSLISVLTMLEYIDDCRGFLKLSLDDYVCGKYLDTVFGENRFTDLIKKSRNFRLLYLISTLHHILKKSIHDINVL